MKRYGEGRGWDDKSLAGRGSVLSRGENTGNASVQREIGKTMADLLADNRRASDAKPSVEIKQVERGTGYVEPRKLEHVLDSFAGRNFDVAGNATAGRWAELRAEGIGPYRPHAPRRSAGFLRAWRGILVAIFGPFALALALKLLESFFRHRLTNQEALRCFFKRDIRKAFKLRIKAPIALIDRNETS
jgi:hypothetical protein